VLTNLELRLESRRLAELFGFQGFAASRRDSRLSRLFVSFNFSNAFICYDLETR
jgi:hypothetical protein